MAVFLGFHSTAELAVFLTSLVVGITMVMGVNAVNSAPSFMLDYYRYVDKSPTATARYPAFWDNVLNFYTVITLVAQTAHEPTNLTSFMCRFSLLFRLEVSSALMLVELLVIVLLPHTGATEVGAMVGIVIAAYLGGAARAYFENTGYALFGPCPSKMLSGMLVGSALSGAIVSMLQIILKAAMPDTYESVLTQSVIYFSFSIGIIFLSAVLLVTLLFNPFAKLYVAEFRSRRSVVQNIYRPLNPADKAKYFDPLYQELSSDHDEDDGGDDNTAGVRKATGTPAAVVDAAGVDSDDESRASESGAQHRAATVSSVEERLQREDVLFDDRVPRSQETSGSSKKHDTTGPLADAIVDESALGDKTLALTGVDDDTVRASPSVHAEVSAMTTSEQLQGVRLWPVVRRIWPMMLSCVLTFGVTYLMYPGLLLVVDAEDGWYTTLVMTVYNVGDLLGRVLSMWKRLWPPRRVVLIASIVRIVFVPLLVLCAVGKIPGHAPAYIFTALLAVTNGFFGTLSMVYSPETPSLKTDGERAMAGQATGVCLLLGCSLGSLIQLAEVLPFN